MALVRLICVRCFLRIINFLCSLVNLFHVASSMNKFLVQLILVHLHNGGMTCLVSGNSNSKVLVMSSTHPIHQGQETVSLSYIGKPSCVVPFCENFQTSGNKSAQNAATPSAKKAATNATLSLAKQV